MDRCTLAANYHHKGYNCCQAVLGAFSDITGLSEKQSMDLAGGFGAGLQTGEVCGAVAGGVMVLGLLHEIDHSDPVASKRRTGAFAKEFQKRFEERFGALRCHPLLKTEIKATPATPEAQRLGLENRCDILIVTAVELLEEMIAEENK